MATTTGTCTVFDIVKDWLGDNSVDLNTDAFSIMLLDNSNIPNRATDTMVSDIVSAEINTGGYARKALANVQWIASTGANGQMMLNADNPVWTVSGSDMIARYWVLFNNTPATDTARNLMAFGLLNDADADVPTTDGNSLTLNVNALGFFTVG